MRSYVLLGLVAVAHGACPNSCSNRGTCGPDEVCICFTGWKGGDCSYRVCPYGPSWSVTAANEYNDDRSASQLVLDTPGGYLKTDVNGYNIKDTYDELYPMVPAFRRYTECSSRGNCNYATGRCNCFTGYEGRGCRRTTCPNKCSGHGKCLFNSEVDSAAYWGINKYNSQFWDQHRTQQCVCDRGFEGFDCSERICPFGDNPKSECREGAADDFQLVYISADNAAKNDFFTLRMRDQFGGTATTRPIHAHRCTAGTPCNEVQYALMELPNFAVPDVEVDLLNVGLPAGEMAFRIHFKDPNTAGKQNTLSCEPVKNSNVDGAAPKYKPVTVCRVFHAGVPEWYTPDKTLRTFQLNGRTVTQSQVLAPEALLAHLGGAAAEALTKQRYKEFIPCSGRGTCNKGSGICKCQSGAIGEGCRVSTTYS